MVFHFGGHVEVWFAGRGLPDGPDSDRPGRRSRVGLAGRRLREAEGVVPPGPDILLSNNYDHLPPEIEVIKRGRSGYWLLTRAFCASLCTFLHGFSLFRHRKGCGTRPCAGGLRKSKPISPICR